MNPSVHQVGQFSYRGLAFPLLCGCGTFYNHPTISHFVALTITPDATQHIQMYSLKFFDPAYQADVVPIEWGSILDF